MLIGVLAEPGGWHLEDLSRASTATGLANIVQLSYRQLATHLDHSKSHIWSDKVTFESLDALIVRAMPGGSLSQIVFRMDLLMEAQSNGLQLINPPKTIEASVDKYLSLRLMKDNGVRVPATGVCQTLTDAEILFEQLGSDVLMKPIFGSQGYGIERIQSSEALKTHCQSKLESEEVVYLQKFVEHGGEDIRVLVIGNDTYAMKRTRPGHWLTNVSQGAEGHPHELTAEEKATAVAASQSVGGKVVGVDLFYDDQHTLYACEVNSAPGWRSFSPVTGIDIATKILEFVATSK